MRHLFLLLLMFPGITYAQGDRITNSADATIAAGSYQGSVSLSYLHGWRFGTKQQFGFGVGGRLTSYLGQNQYYVTAPAQLTSGSTSPTIIFQDNIRENIDSLLVASPQVTALNVVINLDIRFSRRVTAGFNIDVIGFSIGGTRTGNYINGSSGKITSAAPAGFNALLVSDNDRGSLNSELYLKYAVNDKWAIKAGGQFLFTEYVTDTKVQTFPEANDRFRNKSLLFCLGIVRNLNKQ